MSYYLACFLQYKNIPGHPPDSGWDWVSCAIGIFFGLVFGGILSPIFCGAKLRRYR